jgi:hypothetical protein
VSDSIIDAVVVNILLEAMRTIIKERRITGPNRRPLTLVIKLTPQQRRKLEEPVRSCFPRRIPFP